MSAPSVPGASDAPGGDAGCRKLEASGADAGLTWFAHAEGGGGEGDGGAAGIFDAAERLRGLSASTEAHHIARGNATRAREGSPVERVFAPEQRRIGLIVRRIGIVRATARIALANLAHNMRRPVWIEVRTAPA